MIVYSLFVQQTRPRQSLLPLVLLPLRELLHDLLVSLVRGRLALLLLALLPLQQLLHAHPVRVAVRLLAHAAQRQPPHALVLLAQLRLTNAHNLPVDVLLLVVALRQRGLPVPQVVQPRLPQQREVEAAEPQVRQPLQPVLPEVLQARVERGHGARLLHDHEATREAARRVVRLLLRVRPAGVRHDGVRGGQCQPAGQGVLLEVRRRGGGHVHARVAEVDAGLRDGAHAKVVLGEREEYGHSRMEAEEDPYSD